MAIGTAFRAFFATLFNKEASARVDAALSGKGLPAPEEKKPAAKPKPKPAPKKPERSEAITLLAALQREGRFVDFLQEELDAFSDDQVGAAAREVHRECRAVIERMFAVAPLRTEEEGDAVETPSDCDPGLFRLLGDVSGEGPFKGTLAHHGWKATRCETPTWAGSKDAAMVIAPAEVEV